MTTLAYTNTELTNDVTYEYVVTASNGLESAPSNVAAATPTLPPPPAAPTGLNARANGRRRIDLSWNASSGAVSYHVKRSTTRGGGREGYTTIARVAGRTFSNSVPSGKTYYYVVSAVNAGGESGHSAQASAAAK